ncbi:MAG: hypothetical protein NVSMB2_20030 [Chloroflexota bacterium]
MPSAEQSNFGIGALFWHVSEAVIVGDASTGRIVRWNPAAQAIFGYTEAEALGQSVEMLVPDELKARHRGGLTNFAHTGHGAIVDGSSAVELPAIAKDGSTLWVELSLSALGDPSDTPRHVLALIRDVTERKRNEQERLALATAQAAQVKAEEQAELQGRLNAALRELVSERDAALADAKRASEQMLFLAEASRQLAGSLDYKTILSRVAQLAVPVLADWCAVDVLADGESIARVAVAHVNPNKVAIAEEIARRYPPDPQSSVGTASVLRSGQPQLLPVISKEFIAAAARDADHLALLQQLAFSSAITVPMSARGRVLGALTLAWAESGRHYDQADLALAEELAQRAAFAVDNGRLYGDATERARHAELVAEVGVVLTAGGDLVSALQQCTEALVQRMDAAFARVWTLDETEDVLVLRASAGLYTHLDGEHGRVPVGSFKIGEIAFERQPHLTNDVLSDPRVHYPDWARREGMVAFAGYPLLVGDKVVGVIALFARQPLPASSLQALGAIADAVALAVDRATAEAERERLMLELREGIRIRDDFLAAASHDLKNPLAAVLGAVQILQRLMGRGTPVPPERLTAGLDMIGGAAKRMAAQIDELLDVARLQLGGDLPLDRASTDLVALAREHARAQESGTDLHRIVVEAAVPELIGLWDPARLGRVLDNLLNNAIKYSPSGGEVIVSIARDDHAAVVTITDQGIGIPAADQARLFERFQRGANVSGRIAGTGIGLVAARQIVEQHGGTLALSSEEGGGTTVTVRLPLRAPSGDTVSEAG